MTTRRLASCGVAKLPFLTRDGGLRTWRPPKQTNGRRDRREPLLAAPRRAPCVSKVLPVCCLGAKYSFDSATTRLTLANTPAAVSRAAVLLAPLRKFQDVVIFDSRPLTARSNLMLIVFISHAGIVCLSRTGTFTALACSLATLAAASSWNCSGLPTIALCFQS